MRPPCESRKQAGSRSFKAPPSGAPALPRSLVRAPLIAALLLAGCATARVGPAADSDRQPAPLHYVVNRTAGAIKVDGRLDDPAWSRAPWTGSFVDIEGARRPSPRFRTRVKMLWDDQYWYLAAELEEPELWATIRERDAVIFRDNDFEIFVDPSGTARRYFEVEVNQFATVWDLFLPKAYRDGGHAVNEWNITGLQVAVSLDGTINHPGDRDRGWTVEMAIPWAALADSGHNVVPPRTGDRWRVNFSRVEWLVDSVEGVYAKRKDATGRALPEDNWVWSPQGVVNMHVPERWGTVQFGGEWRRP